MKIICKVFGHKVHQFNSALAFCTRCSLKWQEERTTKTSSVYAHPAYYNKISSQMDTTKPKATGAPYSGDAYCVNCKVTVPFEGWVRVSDSGRRMAYGKCTNCGTKVNRILGKDS